MTKTITVMAITAILVLSTFALANTADAFIQPSSSSRITSIGPASCETPTDGDCGQGLLKSKVQLLGQEINGDFSTGIGKIKMVLNIHQMGGLELSSKSLSYTYDAVGNVISISGHVKASNGSIWQMSMIVNDIVVAENTGNCETTLTAPSGSIIVSNVECNLFGGGYDPIHDT